MKSSTNGLKIVFTCLFTSLVIAFSLLFSVVVEASDDVEVVVTHEEYCARIVDAFRENDLILFENKEDIKLHLFYEIVLGEMIDTTYELYAETLKAMQSVNLENIILMEMYDDACENETSR